MYRTALLVGLVVAATGCGGEAAPRWAVQHGTIDVGSDGIEGYQVWEFFGRKWKKKRDEKHHVCALVQTVDGALVTELDGCLGCVATYQVSVADLETDCAASVVGDDGFGGVRYLAVGEVPADEASLDPFPGRSLGWYLSWDGEVAEYMGFAYHEDLDDQGAAPVSGWSPGERYVLEPAYAWEL